VAPVTSGIVAGYIFVVSMAMGPAILAGLIAWRRHRRARREATQAIWDANHDQFQRLVDQHDEWDRQALGAVVAAERLEPWTPLEREIFGINDLDKWIRETDRELATGDRKAPTPRPILNSPEAEEFIIRAGTIEGGRVWIQR
jgi:hypothetical protein